MNLIETALDLYPKIYKVGDFELRYLALNNDLPSNNSSFGQNISKTLHEQIPQADVLAIEYFGPEIDSDLIFAAQSIRYSVTTALAERYQKPVLTVDPAFESQFLVDFRVIPFSLWGAGVANLCALAANLNRLNLQTRRGFFTRTAQLVGGLSAIASGGSFLLGEIHTGRLMNQHRTPLVSEGEFRRTVIIQNLINYAVMASNNGQRSALVVFSDWLEPALDLYISDRDLLVNDLSTYLQFKDNPRFAHYFQARLYTPSKVGDKTSWDKTLLNLI